MPLAAGMSYRTPLTSSYCRASQTGGLRAHRCARLQSRTSSTPRSSTQQTRVYVSASGPTPPDTWDKGTYRLALMQSCKLRREFESPLYQSPYATITTFKRSHACLDDHHNLQYADDYLKGNMTPEEYQSVNAACQKLDKFWHKLQQQYQAGRLADTDRLDFFANDRWLLDATLYRLLVEPLAIAQWYKDERQRLGEHYAGATPDGQSGMRDTLGRRGTPHAFLESMLWRKRARLPNEEDSLAKAREYEDLFWRGQLELQTSTDACAQPPVGFRWPAPPPAKGFDTWACEVVISHASKDRRFVEEVQSDIGTALKLKVSCHTVDVPTGGDAAVGSSLVGLAVITTHYVCKDCPVQDLRILVDRKTLHAVLYQDMSLGALEQKLKKKLCAAPVKEVWDSLSALLKTLELLKRSTVHVESEDSCTILLRQKLCWHVVEILVKEVCPNLPNSVRTYNILKQWEHAASQFTVPLMFEELPRKYGRQSEEWVEKIRTRLKELKNVPPGSVK
ncbi:hypothetical protein WJX72_005175 [[Myrmecia] bisecta]|uniref:EDS1 EP domain-containing protein n=1 Tax=[Myrmecia] bisecta TaxID=41462 RepID=A0AAW1PNW2_9CHLO